MWKRIKAMWNLAFGPFPDIEPPSTIVNNYLPPLPKAAMRVFVNGKEYEWWVTANTPWKWPEFFTVGKSPRFDIFRQVGYEEIIEEEIFKDGSPMVEMLADAVHDVWVGWMEYQFTKGFTSVSGDWIMNKGSYDRWNRQMKTPYAKLSEAEKKSDRDIAKRYLTTIFGPDWEWD